MRLISARVRGAGRLVDTTIKLDQKVVAIVGPNEAGKTTLLNALAFVEGSSALPPAQRSRASAGVPDATLTVSLRYRVTDEDRTEVEKFELEEPPADFYVSRRADGQGPNFTTEPNPRKSEEPLRQLVIELAKALATTTALIAPHLDVGEDEEASEPPDGAPLIDQLHRLREDLDTHLATSVGERDSLDALRQRADEAADALNAFVDTDRFRELLSRVGKWLDREDPR